MATQILKISNHQWEQMKDHVARIAPIEACGMLGGNKATVQKVFETTNILQSPVRYQIDPRQQISIFHQMEDSDMELVAIYHSHPTGPNTPSNIDISEAAYPQAFYLIWFKINDQWDCAGFQIISGSFSQIKLIQNQVE